jgi:Ras-related protein Rab-13
MGEEDILPHSSTVGAGIHSISCEFDNRRVSCKLWDTAGQEMFRSQIPSYLHGAHVVLLVFDLTNTSSFQSLDNWYSFIQDNSTPLAVLVLGNKVDLDQTRAVELSDAWRWASNHGHRYWETSAKSGINVDAAFDDVMTQCCDKPLANPAIEIINPGLDRPKNPDITAECCH